MMFSDITNAVSNAANTITGIGNAASGALQSSIPGTTAVPSGGSSTGGGFARAGGITFLGGVVIYFVLKYLRLLPRWARII